MAGICTRKAFLLAWLGVLSGCLRLGYDSVRTHHVAVPSDAATPDATSDSGRASNPGVDDSGPVSYRAADGGDSGDMSLDAAADASAPRTMPTDAGDAGTSADDSGVTSSCPDSVNACGGCLALPAALGSACGACEIGSYVCDGSDALSCVGSSTSPATSGGSVLLDDFEDGDRFFRAGPFNGSWYLVSDSTAGTLNPSSDDELPTSPGANSSVGALHMSGNGFTDWGAGVQAGLNIDGCYVDATAQTGVGFYARGTGALLFSVATKQTVPTADGGTCVGTCYDNFATSLTLTTVWKYYPVPWSSLHQAGWGTATTFRSSQIKYLQFSFVAGSSLDLYVDDVSLY